MRRARPGRTVALCLVGALLALAACTKQPEPEPAPSPPPAPPATEESSLTLSRIDYARLRAELREREGSVVLLVFWASWCGPCVEEFPYLAEWRDRYGPDGLQLMLVSVDAPEDRAKAVEFLRERGWQGEHWILDVENYDTFVNQVSADWGGPIPTTVVYDRSGEQRAVLVGANPPKEMERAFLPLLEPGSG